MNQDSGRLYSPSSMYALVLHWPKRIQKKVIRISIKICVQRNYFMFYRQTLIYPDLKISESSKPPSRISRRLGEKRGTTFQAS